MVHLGVMVHLGGGRLWQRCQLSMRPVSGQTTSRGPWEDLRLPRHPPLLPQTRECPRLSDCQPRTGECMIDYIRIAAVALCKKYLAGVMGQSGR